jgi:hypothetical protein
LSRYAPNEVGTDEKRQEHFLDGLIGPFNYQLQSHTFLNFQTLLNKAIGLKNRHSELGEKKQKFQSQGQSSSNTRPHYNSSQGFPSRSGGQGGSHQQNQEPQRTPQQSHYFNRPTQRNPDQQHNRSGNTTSASVRTNNPITPVHPDALGMVKWGIMPTSAQSATCKLLRTKRAVDKGLDNSHLKCALEIPTIRATKVNKTSCMVV